MSAHRPTPRPSPPPTEWLPPAITRSTRRWHATCHACGAAFVDARYAWVRLWADVHRCDTRPLEVR